MADGIVTIDVLLNDGTVVKGTSDISKALRQMQNDGEGAGKGLKQSLAVGAAMALAQNAIAAVSNGIKAFAKASIGAAADFQQTMNLVKANSGASASEMAKLNQLAKDLGASTKFSANEAAQAILELTKAGITPAQVQAGALKATMDLAAASGMDLGDAANITANALNTFHLQADKASMVANALAGGANASSADVSDLAQSLAQVGPGATTAGLSLNDTVGVLAAFSQNGIKGSDAGTSLKTMLQNLVPQSDKAAAAMENLGLNFTNADGSFKSISEIAGQLHDKLGNLTQAQKTQALQTLFGSDASRAAAILMNEGTTGVNKYIKATEDQTAAQKMADAYMQGFNGTLEQLSGSAETLGMSLGERVLPALTSAMQAVSQFLDLLSKNMDVVESFIVALVAGAAAFAAYAIIDVVTTSIRAFQKANEGATVAQWALNVAMKANWVGILVTAIAALVTGLVYFFTQTQTGQKIVQEAWKAIQSAMSSVVAWYNSTFLPTVQSVMQAFEQYTSKAVTAVVQWFTGTFLPGMSNAWGSFKGFVSEAVQAMQPFVSFISGAVSTAISFLGNLFKSAGSAIGNFHVSAMAVVGVLTSIAVAFLGVSGPIGIVIGLVAKFITAFIQTGSVNGAIQSVVDNIVGMINMVGQLLPQFIQVGTNLIISLINGILAALPQIINVGTQAINSLIQGLNTAIPIVTQVITQVITVLLNAILGALPLIIQGGIQLLNGLVSGLVTAIPLLVTAMTTVITGLTNAITTALPILVTGGITLLNGLISGLVSALPLLINAATQLINGLLQAIIAVLPLLMTAGVTILNGLITGIIQVLPTLISAALQIINALINAIIPLIPLVINAGIQILMALINGLISALPQIISAIVKLITALLNAIVTLLPTILNAGIQIIGALVKGLIQNLPAILSAIGKLMAALLGAIIKLVPTLLSAGVQLISALVRGVLQLMGSLASAGGQLIQGLINALVRNAGRIWSSISGFFTSIPGKISGAFGNVASIGSNLVDGIIQGVSGAAGRLANSVKDMAKGAVDKVKSFLGIHSPSRKFRDEVGQFIPSGIAVGITANASDATRALADLNQKMMATVTPETALNIGRSGGISKATAIIGKSSGASVSSTTTTKSATIQQTIFVQENPSEREIKRQTLNGLQELGYQIG